MDVMGKVNLYISVCGYIVLYVGTIVLMVYFSHLNSIVIVIGDLLSLAKLLEGVPTTSL